MRWTKHLGVARVASVAAMALAVAGCAHGPRLVWPWHAKASPPAAPIEVLVIRSDDGVPVHAFPQFLERNTLLVDLSGAASTGTIVLTRRDGTAWPVRLAFRVRPAEVKMLEIEGAQRLLLPTSTDQGDMLRLDIAPGVYLKDTPSIRVHW